MNNQENLVNEETTEPLAEKEPTLGQILSAVRVLGRRMDSLEGRMEGLEEKFDIRARETRPMSERIDQLVAAVVETRRELAETRMETRQELRDINHTLRGINLTMSRADWVHDDLETRVEKLERQVGKEAGLQP